MTPRLDANPPLLQASGVGAMQLQSDAAVNLPNALTLASLALGVWWVADGPDWAAVASVILDELDGRIARATGQTSEFGSTYDWATDVLLTALSLQKVGAPWQAIPVVATGQVVLREEGYRPPFLSARGVVMLYGVAKNQGYIG